MVATRGVTGKENVAIAEKIEPEMIRAKKIEIEKTETKTKVEVEEIEAETTRRKKTRTRTTNEIAAEKGTGRMTNAKRKITRIAEEKRTKIRRKMRKREIVVEIATEETTKMTEKTTKVTNEMTRVTNVMTEKTSVSEKMTEVETGEELAKVVR